MFLSGNIACVGYKSAIIFNAFSIGYSLQHNTIKKKTTIGNQIWFSVYERRHAKAALKNNNNMRSAAIVLVYFS